VGQAGPFTLVQMPPLTTLPHVEVGKAREVGGRGEMCVGWHLASPASLPTTPEEGEAGRAWWVDRHPAGLLHPLSPVGGGRQLAGRESGCRRRAPYPTRVSSVLEGSTSATAIPQLFKEFCSATATPQFRNHNFC
jgi:hypothetical protein